MKEYDISSMNLEEMKRAALIMNLKFWGIIAFFVLCIVGFVWITILMNTEYPTSDENYNRWREYSKMDVMTRDEWDVFTYLTKEIQDTNPNRKFEVIKKWEQKAGKIWPYRYE